MKIKIKQILISLGLILVLVSCGNKNENKQVLEALKQEFNVSSGVVEEITNIEWEQDTKCYKVISGSNTYYVAISKNGTDASNDYEAFLWLHKKDKE